MGGGIFQLELKPLLCSTYPKLNTSVATCCWVQCHTLVMFLLGGRLVISNGQDTKPAAMLCTGSAQGISVESAAVAQVLAQS